MKRPAFQLIASFIAMMMIGNLQYTWDLFATPIVEATHWKLSNVQAAYTIFILLQAWVQPASGWFIDRLGQRPFITVAGILCGIGWCGLGWASSLQISNPTDTSNPLIAFKILYGVAGVGAAFVYSGSIGSALKWYPNRRGFASGVIAAGYGGGAALSVWLVNSLIRTYGFQTALWWMGIAQGVVILLIAQVLRHPGADFNPPRPAAAAGSVVTMRRATESFTTREMLSTPHFYVLYLMFVAMSIGGVFSTANAGPLTKAWGLAGALAMAKTLGLMANAGSRPFWGWVSDRMGREQTMTVAFLLQTGCLVFLAKFGPESGFLFTLALVLVYFTWGEIYALFPSTVVDYFGNKYSTSNNSFLYSGKGIAAIIGIYVPTLLFERIGQWQPILYGAAVLALLAAIGAWIMRTVPLPKHSNAA